MAHRLDSSPLERQPQKPNPDKIRNFVDEGLRLAWSQGNTHLHIYRFGTDPLFKFRFVYIDAENPRDPSRREWQLRPKEYYNLTNYEKTKEEYAKALLKNLEYKISNSIASDDDRRFF
jgi:hypothetical protein